MKTEKDHITNIFSSKLNGFEVDLPPSLWGKIESDLPARPSMRLSVRKNTYRTLSWTAVAAAIVVAVLYLVPQPDQKVCEAQLINSQALERTPLFSKIKDRYQTKVTEKTPIQQLSATPLVASLGQKQTPQPSKVTAKPSVVATSEYQSFAVETIIDTVASDRTQYSANTDAKETNFEPADPNFEKELQAKIAAFAASGENTNNILADNNGHTSKANKNSGQGFGLGLEGGGGILSRSQNIVNSLPYSSPDALVKPSKMNEMINQEYKLEHHQPISFGIAVNKRITNRVSLESGLVYTYVWANIRSVSSSVYNQNDRQIFHYLGVPLAVNYKLIEWKKAQLYTSLGGMIQKDFYGKITSNTSIDDLIGSDHKSQRDISQSKPQFSATALLGVSYPLYNKLSVYSTFGGAYYFKANNDYETIFSDRPWLFNVNLGIKFGF